MTYQAPAAQSSFLQETKQALLGAFCSVRKSFKPSTQTSALLLAAGIGLSTLMPAPASASKTESAPRHQEQKLISQQPRTVELTLVSYAVTKAAYDRIIPLFVEKWKREHNGQEVVINGSYGGSGSQTRAVIDGLEADVVQLALAADVKKIQDAELIDPGWEREAPNGSIVTRSVVAFVTRPGNPKRIRTWSDLSRPDVAVITANPKTSGGARWNFLGLWGSITRTGGTEEQAIDFLKQVYSHVPVLAKDARESSDIFFTRGQGDVLLNYENEVILAAQQGETNFFSVIPPVNISIDAPVAIVDKNVDKHKTREVAEAFVQFLFTPEAQRQFAEVGFRPIIPSIVAEYKQKFPLVSQLYTVQELGGWSEAQKKFFADGGIFDQVYTPH